MRQEVGGRRHRVAAMGPSHLPPYHQCLPRVFPVGLRSHAGCPSRGHTGAHKARQHWPSGDPLSHPFPFAGADGDYCLGEHLSERATAV